jgi:hypothetical protein
VAGGGARAAASGMRRIGALMNVAADDPVGQARIAAFLQGLQELGWTVGRNIRIDYRWAAGNADRTRGYAAELVALAPEVILAPGSAAAGPLLQGDRQRAAARVTIRRRSLKNNGLWRMMTASTCSLASLGNAISRSLGTSASTETMPIDSFKPAASTSRRGG